MVRGLKTRRFPTRIVSCRGFCTWCTVNVVTGASGVVTDLLDHKLCAFDLLPVAFVGVVMGVSLGNELIALAESFMGALSGGTVHHEVPKVWLQLGEGAVLFTAKVLLTESGIEACFATIGIRQLRFSRDETRK